MKNDFNLCPMCGSKTIQNKNDRRWFCPDCGFDLYCNIAAAVGVIIQDSKHNILFEVRAKNPRKGYVAFPGGFIDADESAEEAVERECMEEIGAKVKNVKFLCSNPNTYEYKNIVYKTCDMFFTAELDYQNEDSDMETLISKLKAQESEVQDFVYYKVQTLEDVEKIPLAFESAKKTLVKLVSNLNK